MFELQNKGIGKITTDLQLHGVFYSALKKIKERSLCTEQ